MKIRTKAIFSVLLALALTGGVRAKEAKETEKPDAVAVAMSRAAQAFLAALDEEQRETATFALEDDERENWHFVPLEDRAGLTIKEMRPDQRLLAHALLITGMSQAGYGKAVSIMSLEQVLWELENHAPKRDPEKYHVCIFGDPSGEGNWAWRFEGHHLSLSFTIAKGRVVSVTPSFMGANPDIVREGVRAGVQVLAREAGLARRLLQTLDDEQRAVAMIDDAAPKDVLTAQERTVSALEDKGLAVARMNEEQKAMLMSLIKQYLFRHHPRVVANHLADIEDAGFGKVRFAWAGGEKRGEGFYYRIQGTTFLLEYCNTQNDANHSHAVWRSFDGDFGRDLLREHVAQHH